MKIVAIKIDASHRQIYSGATLIIVGNIILLIGTWVCNSIDWSKQNFLVSFFLRESNLAWENTTATWYSSMLLLIVAGLGVLCFIADNNKRQSHYQHIISYGWIVICLIFTLLSLDEIGSIHESIGNTDLFGRLGIREALLSDTFYGFIVIVALFMALFGISRFKNNRWALVFGLCGIILFLTIPLNERFEWSQVPDNIDFAQYKRNPSYIALEEGLELFGSFFFIACLTKHLMDNKNSSERDGSDLVQLNYFLKKSNVFYGSVITIAFFVAVHFIILFNFSDVEKFDNGIPENWFPSGFAFVSSFLSVYSYSEFKKIDIAKARAFLLLSILALLISVYFGSNMYTRTYQNSGRYAMLPGIVLSIAIIITGLNLAIRSSSGKKRIGIAIWMVSCSTSLLFYSSFSASICFISFCLLNISFFARGYKHTNLRSKE